MTAEMKLAEPTNHDLDELQGAEVKKNKSSVIEEAPTPMQENSATPLTPPNAGLQFLISPNLGARGVEDTSIEQLKQSLHPSQALYPRSGAVSP